MLTGGRLAGRVALVTGAGRGIGRAVALRFAGEGADLVLVGRTQGALEEVDDAVRGLGRHAALVVGDLADFSLIDKLGAAVWQRWGRLDVLVGNAAVLGTLTPVGHIEPKTWEQVIAVNLTANWRCCAASIRCCAAPRRGRAIFVTCGVASGRGYWGGYAVSKAGLRRWCVPTRTRSRTRRCANSIDPGARRTRMRATPSRRRSCGLKPADDPALMEAFVALAEPACSRSGELVRAEAPAANNR
ncbi:MAG: SDR family NAD(P)-dependent oxidoreductase [Rhodospirillales bacterium]